MVPDAMCCNSDATLHSVTLLVLLDRAVSVFLLSPVFLCCSYVGKTLNKANSTKVLD